MWRKIDIIFWRITWALAAIGAVATMFGWHPSQGTIDFSALIGVQFGAGAMARIASANL